MPDLRGFSRRFRLKTSEKRHFRAKYPQKPEKIVENLRFHLDFG